MKLLLVLVLSLVSIATAATYPSECFPYCEVNSQALQIINRINRDIGEQDRHSGRYYHDDSGRYIHQPNPYIHQHNPYIHYEPPNGKYYGDDSGRYAHIAGPDGGQGGPGGLGGYIYKKPFGPAPGIIHPNSVQHKYLPAYEKPKSIDNTYLPTRKNFINPINTVYLPVGQE